MKKAAFYAMIIVLAMGCLACDNKQTGNDNKKSQVNEALEQEAETVVAQQEMTSDVIETEYGISTDDFENEITTTSDEIDLSTMPNLEGAIVYGTHYNLNIPENGEVEDDFWDKMISAFICNSWFSIELDGYGELLSVSDLETIASSIIGRNVVCNAYEDDYQVDITCAASPYLFECELKNVQTTKMANDIWELEADFEYYCSSITITPGIKHIKVMLIKNEDGILDGYSIKSMNVETISEPIDEIE